MGNRFADLYYARKNHIYVSDGCRDVEDQEERTGMGYTDGMSPEMKQRIVQELVPGKQISLAHIIANPDKIMYEKLGLNPAIDYSKAAIGIMTVSPSETAIIMGDIAVKSAGIDLGFVDRFSGSLIITGTVSEVEASVTAILDYVGDTLGFRSSSPDIP